MPNYHEVTLPDDKPRDEYSYTERRAAILKVIEQRGHPWGLNKSQLARQFGVSDVQIHKDLDRIKEYYSNRIGSDAKSATEIAYKRILQEQLDNDELDKARRTLDSWNSWLQDTGHQEKEPDKHDMQGEGIVIDLGDE
jgi:transposase-like protein